MVASEIGAFVAANLPAPPLRVLEVGAGGGELAVLLAGLGFDVVAIDPEPRGANVRGVALADLDEPPASFDAAVAVLSLHHVDPLRESLRKLAGLLRPGAPFLIDEFDVGAFDRRAAGWWLERRGELGAEHGHTADELVHEHREHLHPLPRIIDVLGADFEVGEPVRGAYLYRWDLDPSLRPAEETLIACGELPAVGARLVARRAG